MTSLEARLGIALGCPVRLCRADSPLDVAALMPGERARYDELRADLRRRDWLLSRAALRGVLPDGTDTAQLRFPHQHVSVTHGGGVAFAAYADGDVAGTGIDFEPLDRAVSPSAAAYFLGPADAGADMTSADLLRLWTVKESLFKATPRNEGTVLRDYRILRRDAVSGRATGPHGEHLSYVSVSLGDGFLCLAVSTTQAA